MDVTSPPVPDELERLVLAAIAEIRFGAVEVTIHNGRIVQIEKREKVRADVVLPPSERREPPR